MEAKIIQIPIYKAALYFICGDVDECITKLRKKKISNDTLNLLKEKSYGGWGVTILSGYPIEFLIWLKKVPRTIGEYGALVHEISHAVYFLLSMRGVPHTNESDEAFAYLQEYLFNEIDTIISNLPKEEENTNN